jgi:hypothetical protein
MLRGFPKIRFVEWLKWVVLLLLWKWMVEWKRV